MMERRHELHELSRRFEPLGAAKLVSIREIRVSMSSAPRVCRKCGAEICADAPEGLCIACLFETGLDLFKDNPVAGVEDPGPPSEPRPERRKKSDRAKTFADFGDYEL